MTPKRVQLLKNTPKLLVEQFKKHDQLARNSTLSLPPSQEEEKEKDLPRREHHEKNNSAGEDSYSLFKAIIA